MLRTSIERLMGNKQIAALNIVVVADFTSGTLNQRIVLNTHETRKSAQRQNVRSDFV